MNKTTIETLRIDQHYSAFGYAVCRNIIPVDAIDELMDEYEKNILPSKDKFRRQNRQLEEHSFNKYGAMTNALFNMHCKYDPIYKTFSDHIRNILCHDNLAKALAEVTLQREHILMQTMFFEQAHTNAHQDNVYLDTIPNGHLTAAWFALEDIDDNATKFYVIPGSQNYQHDFPKEWIWGGNYASANGTIFPNRYIYEMEKLIDKRKKEMVHPKMNKGDVLFWNSRTIHGSTEGKNPSLTRRSLAVHYNPVGYEFGNLYAKVGTKFKTLEQPNKFKYFKQALPAS